MSHDTCPECGIAWEQGDCNDPCTFRATKFGLQTGDQQMGQTWEEKARSNFDIAYALKVKLEVSEVNKEYWYEHANTLQARLYNAEQLISDLADELDAWANGTPEVLALLERAKYGKKINRAPKRKRK